MARNVFPKKEVGDFYNKHFVCYKLDAEDPSIDGPALAEKYKVKGYPTLLFLNSDGTVKKQVAGGLATDVFLSMGKVVAGVKKIGAFKAIEKKYDAGDRSPELLRSFILKGSEYSTLEMGGASRQEMAAFGAKLTKVMKDYFATRTVENIKNAVDIELIIKCQHAAGIKRGHPLAEGIISNYDEFLMIAKDKKSFNDFINGLNYYGIMLSAGEGKIDLANEYVADMTGKLRNFYSGKEFQEFGFVKYCTLLKDKEYALFKKDYNKFLDLGWKLLQMSGKDASAADYLSYGRRLQQTDCGVKVLKRCEKFVKAAYETRKNAYVVTDYGKLMALVGEKDRARKFYKEAFEMFRKMDGKRAQASIARFTKEMNDLGL